MTVYIRKSHAWLLAVASLAAASGAQAQTSSSSNTGMSNASGPFTMLSSPKTYIGLSAGQTDYSLGNGTGLFGSNNRPTAYSLAGGGYFTNNLGAELAYTDFGRIDRAGGTTRAEGLSLRLIGKLPLSQSFNLLGKIGTTYGRTDVSAAAGSGIASGSDSGFGLSLGVGAEYFFTPNVSAVVQYDMHELRFAGGTSSRDRVGVASLGVRYSF